MPVALCVNFYICLINFSCQKPLRCKGNKNFSHMQIYNYKLHELLTHNAGLVIFYENEDIFLRENVKV
jgi:hypothetical protein